MQGVPPLLKVATWLSAGICLGMQMPADMVWWPWVLASLGAALLFSRSERWQSGCLMACVVLTGACIAAWQRQSLRFPFTDNMQRIEAVVTSEPVAREKSVRVDLLLTENGRQIKGYLAKDERSLSLQPGEGLLLYTRIKPNRQWRQGTFDYAHYLETHGITGSCYWTSTMRPGNRQMQIVGINGHLSWGGVIRPNVGIRPAARLDLSMCEIKSGSGTEKDPYVIVYAGQ